MNKRFTRAVLFARNHRSVRPPRPSRNGYHSPVRSQVESLETRRLLSADVLTYHNDGARTGQNLNETTLTPQNVNSTDFGELFSYPVDGQIYAQPLYVSNLAIPGQGTHNVVFVATEHDSVYAFDADSNAGNNSAPLWQDRFINPAAGITTVPSGDTGTGDVTPEIGITGTPVIDPATNTMYLVSNTKSTDPATGAMSYQQQLHALDISTGAEKFGGPTTIQFTVQDAYSYSYPFDALRQFQRTGLALSNGIVYVTFASHGDGGPYNGVIAGYSASTLQLESMLDVTPNGYNGGIWMSGGAPAIDANGNLFLSVGNGTFDNGGGDWGDSMLKLSTANGGIAVADSFTPFNQADLDQYDLDFGSGGVMLLPTQPGPTPDEAISGGKDGNLYLVNRDAMGGYNATANSNLQTISVATGGAGIYDTPAYFNGSVYVNVENQGLQSFPVVNGQLSASPSASAPQILAFPGATPSISANGNQDAIVWETEYGTNAILHAYDATNVANELYDSTQAGTRDQLGQGVKFAVPTIADGHVFVGTASSLAVFGLLSTSSNNPPATPTNLVATALSPTDVHLTWQENSTNATTFKIERSPDGMNFTQVGAANGTGDNFDDLTVNAGSSYRYYVVAENSAGDSGNSNSASASTPAVPGLVGYWQFNEGSGITAADASGNGDNGTLSGEVTWIPGRIGPAALNFHGAGVRDAHVDIPNEAQLQFTAAQSFTLGVWVQANALDSKWAGIVTKSTDQAPGYGLYLDPANHWAFATSSGTNVIEGSLADTNWHYLTLVQHGDARTRSLYEDGNLVASGAAQDGSGGGDLWVGGSASSIDEYFNGAVDDLRIYNFALSDGQIQALAQVPPTPPPGVGVISGTVFEDSQQTGIQENGEPGVGGVIVFLDDAGTGVPQSNDPTAVTDASGNYSFTGLADGTHRVIAVPSNEQHLTAPASGHADVTIAAGDTVSGVNFGEVDNNQPPLPSQFKLTLLSKTPSAAVAGAPGTATLRVTNTSGSLFNKPLHLELFFSTTPVLNSNAIAVASPTNQKVTLHPKQSHTVNLKFNYPAGTGSQNYYMIGSVTAEKSDGEDQFIIASPSQIAISPPAVNLKSTITNPHGVLVTPGHAGVAAIRLSNNGNVPATGTVTMNLYASAGMTLDDTDLLLQTGSQRVNLGVGKSRSFNVRFIAPSGMPPGSYYVIANITANTSAPDSDAGNDIAVANTR